MQETLRIKEQSTGDNDSLEDIMIAIMRLKTVDGKLIHTQDSWELIKQFIDSMWLSSNPNGFKRNKNDNP